MKSIAWFIDEFPEAAAALAAMTLVTGWSTAGLASIADPPIAALLVTIPALGVLHRAGSRWHDD